MTQEIDIELPVFMMTYFAEPAQTVDKILKVHQKIYDLLSKLDIKDYCASLNRVLVIGIALAPDTFPEPEKVFFRKKQQKLEIRIKMDYQALLQANETETLHLIAKTYLVAIEKFLSKRKDFDHLRFYADVRKLFQEKGILPNPHAQKQRLSRKLLAKRLNRHV